MVSKMLLFVLCFAMFSFAQNERVEDVKIEDIDARVERTDYTPYNFESSNHTVLVLFHDTTVVASLAKRIADRDSLFKALNYLSPSSSYDVMYFDSTTQLSLSTLNNYKSILLVETSFDAANVRFLGNVARDSLKAWINGGTAGNKRTIISIGGDQGYNYARVGSPALDVAFSNELLKYGYRMDNGNLTPNNSITGVTIDVGNVRGYTISPVGSGFWPDGIYSFTGGEILYHYTGRGTNDSVAAVGYNATGYVSAVLSLDPRYFTNGDFRVVLEKIIEWCMANGGTFTGFIPVELTSFSSSVIGSDVLLSWSTATELNNSGFSVERKTTDGIYEAISFISGNGTTTEIQNYSFYDMSLANGTYNYRLKQIDYDGTFEYSKEIEVIIEVPKEFALIQNYPNPFNPSTEIRYQISEGSNVILKVYDILGNEVVTLVNEYKEEGSYSVKFSAGSIGDGSNLSSGVYFYSIQAGDYTAVKKMLLMK